MLKDKVTIRLKPGNGGDGLVSFAKGRKPSGGIGGDGGDVRVVGVTNVYDFQSFNHEMLLQAEDGIKGGTNNSKGRKGNDLILKFPLITKIYDSNGDLLCTVDTLGEEKTILTGGKGGLGNWFFRREGAESLHKFKPGEIKPEIKVSLELELYSDVIFIGLPNAGKSSILASITNAQPKVGHYAFTTMEPQLGRMDGITLMDLPGLIEGTYLGKGLGTKFVKHTKTAKLLVHLISLESVNLIDDYKSIRKEIELIKNNLDQKHELIVLTKSDLVEEEKIRKAVEDFENISKQVCIVSVYNFDSLEVLKNKIRDTLKTI